MRRPRRYRFNLNALEKRYENETLQELADAYGCSKETIRKRLITIGVQRRQIGTRSPGWGWLFKHCQRCGGSDRPHKAFGLCDLCYYRLYKEDGSLEPYKREAERRRRRAKEVDV